MFSVEVPKIVNLIISSFYRFGFWHRGIEANKRETRIKLFYFIFHLLFPLSLFAGGLTAETKDESVFSIETAFTAIVLSVKMFYVIWKKEETLVLIDRIGVYATDDPKQFGVLNEKLKGFNKIVTILISIICIADVSAGLIIPLLGSGDKLFFNIAFPLDWKNDEFSFWLAFAFIILEILFSLIAFLFSVLAWYLMTSCALRYEILGHQIVDMGVTKSESTTKRKISKVEKENMFLRDLIAAIESHIEIKESINQVNSFLYNMFVVQIVTSALSICGSIYCLVFNTSENKVEFIVNVIILIYNVSEIFLVMYFGNETTSTSDRLSYCLFESGWVDQPQSTKKSIIIFGEMLRQPHTLIIMKLYPISLQTFTRILRCAYDMFNILQNLK